MAVPILRMMRSPMFQFTLSDGETFSVRADPVAALSGPLKSLMNCGMSESEAGIAQLQDVDTCTFAKFYEFACRGSLTMTGPTTDARELGKPDPPESLLDRTNKILTQGSTRIPFTCSKCQVRTTLASVTANSCPSCKVAVRPPADIQERRMHILERRLVDRQSSVSGAASKSGAWTSNSRVNQDYTTVFLALARIYTFGQVYMVDSLKARVIKWLLHIFINFNLYTARIADFIALARYAYTCADLPGNAEDGSIDDELKRLVVEFIVCEMDTFWKAEEFKVLMEENNEFMRDVLSMLMKYK